MPVSFYYEQEAEYPALLFDGVEIYSLDESGDSFHATGKIDTGAKWSAIPKRAVGKLSLHPSRIIDAYDYDGHKHRSPAYWVRLEINGLTNKLIEVIARNKSDMLIGRDVLNDLRLISSPSENVLTLENP